jgi:hypothetical protein
MVAMDIRVLVCGGRDFLDYKNVREVLDAYQIDTIINGGATGTDALARRYAIENNIKIETYYADWDRYGRQAGPIRNAEMIKCKPDLIIAFPGGKGTANMIKLGRTHNIPVKIVNAGTCFR